MGQMMYFGMVQFIFSKTNSVNGKKLTLMIWKSTFCVFIKICVNKFGKLVYRTLHLKFIFYNTLSMITGKRESAFFLSKHSFDMIKWLNCEVCYRQF